MIISDQLSRSENDALIDAAIQRAKKDRKLVGFLPEISMAIGMLLGYFACAFVLVARDGTPGVKLEIGILIFLAAIVRGLFFGWVGSKIRLHFLKPHVDRVIGEIVGASIVAASKNREM